MPALTVIIEQTLVPVPGGTGRYAAELTTALAAHPAPGWTVRTVTAWHRNPASAAIAGADGPNRLAVGHRVLAELWLRGLPPRLRGPVQATTPLAPARRFQARRGAGRPGGLVVTVHDAVPWTHPETLTPRGVRWHRVMVARAAEQADAIVVPSLAVADDLAGLFPAAADRLQVIGHGVTALPAPPDAVNRRRRLGLPERYVVSVATLEPRKGLDLLVTAMASAPVAGAHLAVVGQPGWGSLQLAGVAAAAGLPADRVHVLGRLDDTDLAAVLAGAMVLAAPSRAEGFGLPVLEAMAAGIPVVTSDAPALVELTAGAALIVPRDDAPALASALGDVLGDPAAAIRLADAGRRRAADFSWATAARRVWALHTGATPANDTPAVTAQADTVRADTVRADTARADTARADTAQQSEPMTGLGLPR